MHNAVPRTIIDAIANHAANGPGRPAIVCAGLPAFSFRELNQKIRQIGDSLRAAGIGASSRVGIALPNGPEAAVVAIAVSAHAISFPLNPALTASEFEFELRRADLDALVLPDWFDTPATAPARALSIGILHASRASGSLAEIDLGQVVAVPFGRRRSGTPSSRSVSVIQMSSGSTGTPKLILVTHDNLFDIAAKMQTWFRLSVYDRCACILPIYSGFGFKIALVAPLLIGGSVAIAKTQQPEHIATWSAELNPTWFVATPTLLRAALDRLRSAVDGEMVHSLRFFASTSAYLPEAVRTGLETILGIPGLEFYGLREAGIVAANPAPPTTRKPGSVGLISPDDVAILNNEGEILPRGDPGAIAVRGQGVSPGYIDALPSGCDMLPNPDMSPNRWALTGDLGIVDADGFLSITGRVKEIVNRGGEKISPYEIEKALLQHPEVREAGAFAVPHPRLGENVAAAVVVRPGATVTSLQLRDFLLGHLAASKIPQHIDLVTALPKGANGKLLRQQLKEAAINRQHQIVPPEQLLEFQIADIWQRLLNRSDIGIHDDFFEAGGDSLLAAQMLLEVEAAIGHSVPQSALTRASTIRQLATIAAEDASGDDELVTKAADGSGTPFFFCHGDVSTRGFYALKLAALLERAHPLYLLHPFRDVEREAELTIEAMARLYVSRLLEIQPVGSFRLGGFCSGGALAWEITNQLIQAGRKVEFVILLETISLNARRPFRALQRVLRILTAAAWSKSAKQRLRRSGMRIAWDLSLEMVWGPILQSTQGTPRIIAQRFNALYRFLKRRRTEMTIHRLPFDSRGLPHSRALANYIPPALTCDVIWIVSEQSVDNFLWSFSPWTRLGQSFHRLTVPGEHETCVTTHIEALAQSLNGHLAGREHISDDEDEKSGLINEILSSPDIKASETPDSAWTS